MRKYVPQPKASRTDERTGDEFVRQWCEHLGTIVAAGKVAGLSRTHLHTWLDDPNRRLSWQNTLKLAKAAGLPVEALVDRWTPIKDLYVWRWVRRK